jgi:hypothetical protein
LRSAARPSGEPRESSIGPPQPFTARLACGEDVNLSEPSIKLDLENAEDVLVYAIRLEGHGGYEGLYAMIQADFRDDSGWDVTGYILERDVPTCPEPVSGLGQ